MFALASGSVARLLARHKNSMAVQLKGDHFVLGALNRPCFATSKVQEFAETTGQV